METKQTEEPDLFELTNINVQLLRQDMLLLAHAVDQVVLISHQIERTIERQVATLELAEHTLALNKLGL